MRNINYFLFHSRAYAHITGVLSFLLSQVSHFSIKTLIINRLPWISRFVSSSSRFHYFTRRIIPFKTLVTAKKLNCCWKACALTRTHVRPRKLERMHATSTAFELYLSDLSPFALCAPSFLRRLWVGKVFRIENHLNLLTTISNFNIYIIFFVTFLRFFPSLGLYLPIYL